MKPKASSNILNCCTLPLSCLPPDGAIEPEVVRFSAHVTRAFVVAGAWPERGGFGHDDWKPSHGAASGRTLERKARATLKACQRWRRRCSFTVGGVLADVTAAGSTSLDHAFPVSTHACVKWSMVGGRTLRRLLLLPASLPSARLSRSGMHRHLCG